jgi:hypothetical protein
MVPLVPDLAVSSANRLLEQGQILLQTGKDIFSQNAEFAEKSASIMRSKHYDLKTLIYLCVLRVLCTRRLEFRLALIKA